MPCEKLPTRFEMWEEWRKSHRGPWLYEILVLLGVVGSPTFEHYRRFRSVCEFDEDIDGLLEEVLENETLE